MRRKRAHGSVAQVAGGFQQRTVDFFQADIDGQDGEGRPGMRQGHHDRKRIVKQKSQRLADQVKAHQSGIDHAIKAQDDLPREDPQQIGGPEGNGQRHQPDEFAPGVKRDEIGHGIGETDCRERHQGRDDHGAKEQGAIARLAQHRGVLGERPAPCHAQALLALEAGQGHQQEGRGQPQRHDKQGRGQEGIAFSPVSPVVRHVWSPAKREDCWEIAGSGATETYRNLRNCCLNPHRRWAITRRLGARA